MDIAQNAPDTVILAEDEASLYLQATTMAVWAPRGHPPAMRVQTQRDKVCFYGTLNLQTGQETVTQEATMNAAATARHLECLLATYPDVPLLLFLDRAPWHGGEAVQAVLQANPRLELMRFPVAAPDLNPQEHVWKAARSATSHNHDERKLKCLADRFAHYLSTTTFSYSLLEKFDHSMVCAMFK